MTLASLQVNALIWTIMDSRVRVEGYQRKVHIGNYQIQIERLFSVLKICPISSFDRS